MTSARQLAKFNKALAEAAKVFDDVDITQVKLSLPLESTADKLREAASVIAYFDMKEKFRVETCRSCKGKFAYAYYSTAVKYCSIPCIDAALRELGFKWDPEAPLERRWGRFIPAVVPATVYKMIEEQTPPEEEPTPVVISSEAEDLIKALDLLS